ncbi:C-type lectin domain family 10 member A-like isoform X2 [Polypterus senegalus]|uniref:C-type lectin domain family 10 member A-like isoform X2 n=1 Tax=Polypterus senegalus TaxID=55291 RepID=UPI00196463AB|nr:C-type lectin domain family 10 member A-like isoform X2 [Polypterus senegalus]
MEQQQGLQESCNHVKWAVIAVFLSGCILAAYRVIEYKTIISPNGQGQSIGDSNHKELQWWDHKGKSYYFENSDRKGWAYADMFCKKRGSNLTIIKKNEEMNFILDHIVLHTWTGVKKKNEKWIWIDGTALGREIFADVEQQKNGHDCGSIMKGGILLAAPCKTPNYWICEKFTVQK